MLEVFVVTEIYEVWSVDSGSVLTAYPTVDEALAHVRSNFEEFGVAGVQGLMIVRERRGRSSILWQGESLVSRIELGLPTDTAPRKVG